MKHAKRTVCALINAGITVALIYWLPAKIIVYLLGVFAALCMLEFLQLSRKKVAGNTVAGFAVNFSGFAVLAFAFTTLAWIVKYFPEPAHNLTFLAVLAIIKLSDMGGFALGVAFGKHKMCPSISPNKSWEGMFGSVLGSTLMAFAFSSVTGLSWRMSIVVGVIAAVTGTAGDLVESKFKRWVGVKDSSTFMPAGLGGFLDMFDSLLFAPAVIACCLAF